jgi:hypothetical protein
MDLKKRLGVMVFQQVQIPVFDWESHSRLQTDLAENYVSVIFGEVNPPELQELSKAGKLGYREFFTQSPSLFSQQLNLSISSIEQAEKVILAVFVPSHKPLNQFGMEQAILDELQELAKNKRCILIHFGNPLALKHLGKLEYFEAVICAYQGFEEVQGVMVKTLQGL